MTTTMIRVIVTANAVEPLIDRRQYKTLRWAMSRALAYLDDPFYGPYYTVTLVEVQGDGATE